ncbi:MAG: hypothetical protein EAX86_07310 [Candidatus Heimdallarchaeota archaeon]|nr:hypothetical protein [Candidatus Heimdallarchaeota archaeon]
MVPPKIISIYSRTSGCGKKTIALNVFTSYARSNPGSRILIVDFSITEKLRYSLLSYGKSHFTSSDFIREISDDILVEEALVIFEDANEDSFLRVLPSSGCAIPDTDLHEKIRYRTNSLFFKDTINLLVFILPSSLEDKSISMSAILNSDIVWTISTEKYPTLNLTKSTIKNFFTFLTKPSLLILNMIRPPIVFNQYDQYIESLETKLRHPVFYSIPWSNELNEFPDKGVFVIENPESRFNDIFDDLSNKYYQSAEKGTFIEQVDESEAPPIALFITGISSGSTMYYYFFGKSEDEMKNPALITAAMASIALMVSETAGRRGDLRYIDNGNIKIIQRKGKKVVGILYSPTMNESLTDMLFNFIKKFELEYNDAINDFGNTGRLGGFKGANKLVEEIFESFIFDITTVSDSLRSKILSYGGEKDLLRGDPEELFKDFVRKNYQNPEVQELLFFEFTTPHNARHDFLREVGINPRAKRRSLEEKIGKKICDCTEPPKYIQIQAFDTLGMLSLPEELRPTVRALFTSNILSPETAAKITKRDHEIEQQSLEQLRKLGYVKRVDTYSE